jgi:hypothetical protein
MIEISNQKCAYDDGIRGPGRCAQWAERVGGRTVKPCEHHGPTSRVRRRCASSSQRDSFAQTRSSMFVVDAGRSHAESFTAILRQLASLFLLEECLITTMIRRRKVDKRTKRRRCGIDGRETCRIRQVENG